MTQLTQAQLLRLRRQLDPMLEEFDYLKHRAQDPVDRVWSYHTPQDQELAALCASGVAYGRVALVKDAGRRILEPLGDSPAATLMTLEHEDLRELYHDYVYRMTRGDDVIDLLLGVKRLLDAHGSLDEAYALGPGKDHSEKASSWVRAIRQGRARQQVARGFKYLLPDPGDGGASKRLHLFFRWMGRGPDAVDLGAWRSLDARDLLMPLDTHTARICAYVGMTKRKSVDAKMVKEVTETLKALDPDDPIKYDFALCHIGISKSCLHERSEQHCPQCPLEPLCIIGNPKLTI